VSATAPSTKADDNAIELAALERMLRRANGFRVAFAVANHPHLRRRLAERVRRDLPDRRIVEVRLDQEPDGVVAAIDAAAANDADAVFVHGLELLDPLGSRARATAALNLNRDYLWRTIRVPVVLWVPDFAVRAFARAAPDLWSGRSGLYRFGPEAGDAAVTAQDTMDGFGWSLSPGERREREALLRDLHEELGEVGAEPAARAVVLSGLGDTARMQGRHADASALYDQALAIYREIGDRHGEANTLRAMGETARMQGRHADAAALYDQALPLYREIGSRLGEANILTAMGETARMQDRHADASALYDQALPLYREIGDRLGEANTLRSLGTALAGAGSSSATGVLHDAARIYELLGRDVLAEDIRRYAHGLQPVEE